jgi:geranylgeranyl diphosphate synthase type II
MALEMIHCYSLIHDDLPAMDDDDLRRGRPTCHIQFDEATAILAGDALQPLAFQTLYESDLPLDALRDSSLVLAKACGCEGMVGGQMDDLLAEKRDAVAMPHEEQIAWLRAIHRRKTGALIQAAVELGGIAGRATRSQQSALSQYGRAIGISFQIVDDLLDVESTSENTGKATGKDSARGKLTYPTVFGVEESREQARACIKDAVAAIECLGDRNESLVGLAHYILERSN